ncbi:MAG: hypothetical protein RBG13Loki_3649 [Promethearchaeota archaeon CR_4]|nr:MAG: hypothetical protein RBG13Loki_3649 [Candidatus Lokiarchaeota archaeon CR_4]
MTHISTGVWVISDKKFKYFFSTAVEEYERAFQSKKFDEAKRKKHAEQAIEQFRTALTHIPSELKRREKKDQQELIHEYLSTLHLLLAEMNFLAGATLEATTHYRDALDCNTRATRNKTQIKRQVLAQERLAVISARIGKFDTAFVNIEWALDSMKKVDLKDQIEGLQDAIAIFSKIGDQKRVEKLKRQLGKIQSTPVASKN